MKVQHTATLDFTDNGVFETGWRIKQGDYGNTELVLRLVNNGVNVYDAEITPQIAFRRWDGASVISVMTPNDQTYKYAFAGNELEVPGLTLCDVKFTDAEGRVSTASCRFTVVEDTVGYDPTGAHTYDNPVSELVEQATNAAEAGIESSFKAEGFAVGEQGGVPVAPDSPYYHNNAKWWAQQAGDPIGTAVEEQTTTTGQFTTKTGGKLESGIVAFEPVQSGSGDPSPDNVRPITGHSSVEVWEHGKNYLPMTLSAIKSANTSGTWSGNVYTLNNVAFTVLTDIDGNVTGINANGTASNITTIILQDNVTYSRLPNEMTLSGCPSGGSSNAYGLRYRLNASPFSTLVNDYGDGASVNIPNDGKEYQLIIRIGNGYNVQNKTFYPMLRLATDTDDTFVPYQGQDITVSLGNTYYSGTLDVVSGVLTVDKVGEELSDLTWQTRKTGTNNKLMSASVSYLFDKTNYDFITEKYKYIEPIGGISQFGEPDDEQIGIYPITTSSSKTIYIVTTVSDTISGKVVYKLAEPITIQLTPQQINTLIGENIIDVPMTGQSLTSAVYRELFAWSDVEDVVELRLPISAIGTDESNNDTASQAYSQGDYFYKNGIAKAKTSIASGATFTLGTNYEIKTLAEILKALES